MKMIYLISIMSLFSCKQAVQEESPSLVSNEFKEPITMEIQKDREIATLGNGCFWCTEAVFSELKGVEKVVSGYTGGTVKNPSYKEVSAGTTGHAEALQIIYDPAVIAYEDLLEIFFATHNPTTLNRQGGDVGTQYRSEIFYHSEDQKTKAENYIALITKEKLYSDPIVTKISPAVIFYDAEDYHKDYYTNNQSQGYCQMVIAPKLEKLRKYYKSKLK